MLTLTCPSTKQPKPNTRSCSSQDLYVFGAQSENSRRIGRCRRMCAIRRLFRMSLDDDWHLPALAVCRHERRPPEADPRQNFPNTVMDHKQTSGPELIGLRAGGLHLCTIEVLDQRGIADRFPVRYRKTLSLCPQLLLGDQALHESWRRITDHPVNRVRSLNHSRRGVHAPTLPRVVMIDQHLFFLWHHSNQPLPISKKNSTLRRHIF